jgi:hypothetical protein
LDFDGAAHGVDHATKFDDQLVSLPELIDDPTPRNGVRASQVLRDRPRACQTGQIDPLLPFEIGL